MPVFFASRTKRYCYGCLHTARTGLWLDADTTIPATPPPMPVPAPATCSATCPVFSIPSIFSPSFAWYTHVRRTHTTMFYAARARAVGCVRSQVGRSLLLNVSLFSRATNLIYRTRGTSTATTTALHPHYLPYLTPHPPTTLPATSWGGASLHSRALARDSGACCCRSLHYHGWLAHSGWTGLTGRCTAILPMQARHRVPAFCSCARRLPLRTRPHSTPPRLPFTHAPLLLPHAAALRCAPHLLPSPACYARAAAPRTPAFHAPVCCLRAHTHG